MNYRTPFSCFAVSALGLSVTAALELRVYNPAAHLRMTGFPTAPQVNPNFLNPS
ncbi:MAG: hypothetical protein ACRCXD_02565 [Luteolibacter sp.]